MKTTETLIPKRVSIYWFTGAWTFYRIEKPSVEKVIEKVRELKALDPGGSLCPVILLTEYKKEISRVGLMCHANSKDWEEDLKKWITAVKKHPYIQNLLLENSP